MGVAPDGSYRPNGTDFWWDSFNGNTGNCWYGNHPFTGKSITTSPPLLPDCANGTNPSLSVGTGAPQNESELLSCFAAITTDSNTCDWFTTPPKPSG
jgi:hypothetical protein